jgi:peptidyl-prolyl cis-trans isomerase B (cyclophilin B)
MPTHLHSIGLAILAVAFVLSCAPAEDPSTPTPTSPSSGQDEIAVLDVQGFGEIRLQFFPDKAPGHVENFKKLARQGFYDGTTFHRIIPGFMIQGGDPKTKDDNPNNDGTGDPGYKIKAEFNDIPHKRGIVSMARSSHPDSAGSQFFIVVKGSPFLDGKYTAFGEVSSGMDVADKIVSQPRDRRDRPLTNIVMKSVRIE